MTDTSREAFEKWREEMLPQCDNIDDAVLQAGIAVTAWQAAIAWHQAELTARLEAELSEGVRRMRSDDYLNGVRKVIAIVRGGE